MEKYKPIVVFYSMVQEMRKTKNLRVNKLLK